MKLHVLLAFLLSSFILHPVSSVHAITFDLFELSEANKYRLEFMDDLEEPHLILRCGPVILKIGDPNKERIGSKMITFYEFKLAEDTVRICKKMDFLLEYKDPDDPSRWIRETGEIIAEGMAQGKIELNPYFGVRFPSLSMKLRTKKGPRRIFLHGKATLAPHVKRIGTRFYILNFPELKEEENGIYTLEIIFDDSNQYLEDVFKINDALIPVSKLKTKVKNVQLMGEYIVKSGDTLYDIAKIFGVHPSDIAILNGIENPELLRTGMKLKIGRVKFEPSRLRIKIDLDRSKLHILYGDHLIGTYPATVGRGSSTPVGKYEIMEKKMNPILVWNDVVIPPGTLLNGLGSRWIGLSNPQYGIHGTTKPWEIGRRISHGCVRLFNRVVELVFDIVHVGTEVLMVNDEDETILR